MTTTGVLFIIAIVTLLLLAIFVILPRRIKRAVLRVIQTFRDHNATNPKNAITHDELSIRPSPSMLSLSMRLKDYEQDALDALIRSDIIQVTEDGKLYLSEDKLVGSKLGQQLPRG